jgi:hypothetical protein
VSRIIVDNHGLGRNPLTRLATLATLSPKGARALSKVTRDRTLGPSVNGVFTRAPAGAVPGLSAASVSDRTPYRQTGRTRPLQGWQERWDKPMVCPGFRPRLRAETAVLGRAVRAHDTVK